MHGDGAGFVMTASPDPSTLNELLQHEAWLRGLARVLGGPSDAEDLVQDVYVRALKPAAVERFEDRSAEGTGGVRAYLFAIAHNVFYSKIKREARAPTAVGEFFAEASNETPPDEAPPAWDLASLDWEQVDGTLRKAIEDLKPEYREVLLLWGVEGLKYREIASIIEAPIGTVMSRLHRADRKSTRLNSSHTVISYAVFCLKKKKKQN